MEVLSCRIIIPVADLAAARHFYEDTLGLAVYREYGAGGSIFGVVLFVGGGFLELTEDSRSEVATEPQSRSPFKLWIQVRDIYLEQDRLMAAGVQVLQAAQEMPWGLHELWLSGHQGVEIRLIQVPPEHPLRRRVD